MQTSWQLLLTKRVGGELEGRQHGAPVLEDEEQQGVGGCLEREYDEGAAGAQVATTVLRPVRQQQDRVRPLPVIPPRLLHPSLGGVRLQVEVVKVGERQPDCRARLAGRRLGDVDAALALHPGPLCQLRRNPPAQVCAPHHVLPLQVPESGRGAAPGDAEYGEIQGDGRGELGVHRVGELRGGAVWIDCYLHRPVCPVQALVCEECLIVVPEARWCCIGQLGPVSEAVVGPRARQDHVGVSCVQVRLKTAGSRGGDRGCPPSAGEHGS